MLTSNQKHFLKSIDDNVLFDEPMKAHTTFKIGGNATAFINISSQECLIALMDFCKSENITYYIVGNGSNLLVSDDGIDGVVICLGRKFANIEVDGTKIIAQSGALLPKISAVAAENSLTGLEFASGIPASLGGAIYMNAGAYGGEMKDVVKEIEYIDENSQFKTISVTDETFSYRHSVFTNTNSVILKATFELKRSNQEEIKNTVSNLNKKRREKQPLEMPSAGSAFKRPDGYFAAALIEQAGLKGKTVGGAMVSDKHSGFIVNTGNATAEDVCRLVKHIREVIYDKFKVLLEPEIKIIGRDWM